MEENQNYTSDDIMRMGNDENSNLRDKVVTMESEIYGEEDQDSK